MESIAQTIPTQENTMSLAIQNILLEHLDFEEDDLANGILDTLVSEVVKVYEAEYQITHQS
tara:strand:+ start:207 stop:389 length:183 start_codon:yes stop_codon:yes gene_type:complete